MTTPPPTREFTPASAIVLVVDGEEPVRVALQQYLHQEKFDVMTAGSVADALHAMNRAAVGCVLLDARAPGPSPREAIPLLQQRDPTTTIVILADREATTLAEEALAAGATERLGKPVDLFVLAETVRLALRRRDALHESERINTWLQEEVAARTAELRRERENLQQLSVAAMEALVNALEAKDPHLRGHSARIARLSEQIARALALDAATIAMVGTAGRLHDIGKIGIREGVLNKQGPLTNAEFAHIKEHAVLGAQILAPLTHLGEAIRFVRGHHEHWDGQGYPDGLEGEDIPIGARIIGAAETFDALTTSRPYQQMMTPAQAVTRMRDLIGTVLDPAVHEALARVVAAGEAPPVPGPS